MGKAYKCDRCGNYFDKMSAAGIVMDGRGVNLSGRITKSGKDVSYHFSYSDNLVLCDACGAEIKQILSDWLNWLKVYEETP